MLSLHADSIERSETSDMLSSQKLPDMSARERQALRLQQAQSIMRMTPWTVSFNIAVSLVVLVLGHDHLPPVPLHAWVAYNIVVSTLILLHWVFAARRCASRACVAGYVRAVIVQGLLLAVAWALAPILFYESATGDMRILISTLTIGAFSLGAYRLSQVPVAAAIYVSLPALSLAWASLRYMEPAIGAASAILLIVYALAVMLIAWMRYEDALKDIRNLEQIKRQRNIIRMLLNEFEENASDWLWETDADGRLLHATPRLEEITGRALAELKGQPLHLILGVDRNEEGWRKFYTQLALGRTVHGMVLPARIHGQERWYSLTGRPLFNDDGELSGFRGVAGDITAQVLHERQLRKEKEVAQREARAKSEFLALISHELRTPLNAMVGFSELLEKEVGGPLSDEYREYVRHISQGSRQLLRLINDILDYTRFERRKITLMDEVVDLVELAELAVRQAARDPRAKGLKMDFEAPDEDILVRGDMGRLKQVIDNLLTNAVKFTEKGGVTLSITRTEDGGVRVAVSDTGPGVPAAEREALFEPFRQAEGTLTRRHDGIGLGLPIARKLIRLHGGDLWLEEAPGGGCRAVFTLPSSRVIGGDAETARAAA